MLYVISINLLYLFINPYYVLVFSILVGRKFFVQHIYVVPFMLLSFAIFYSSRNIGVEWGSGSDDVSRYLEIFHNIKNSSYLELIVNFIISPKNNEILFFIFTKIIATLFNDDYAYVFVTYLIIVLLAYTAASLKGNRDYLIYFFFIVLGFGSFGEQGIMHLWRSTLSALLLFNGIIIIDRYRILGSISLLCSMLTHIASIPILFLYVMFRFIKNFTYAKGIILFITILTSALFLLIFFESYLPDGFFSNYLVYENNYTVIYNILLIMLVVLLSIRLKSPKHLIEKFAISFFCSVIFMLMILPSAIQLWGRYAIFTSPIFNMLVANIICNSKKYIPLVLLFFVIKMNSFSNSPSISAMYNDFLNPFQGILVNVSSAINQ